MAWLLPFLRITGPLTALRALIGWPLAFAGLFAFAGLIGGIVPSRIAATPDAALTETLYVESNGMHVGLIVPTERFDPGLLRARDFADARVLNASHLRFGWGQHRFYREVPDWSRLTPRIAVSALLFDSRALVHVSAAHNPNVGTHVRAIRISRRQMDSILMDIAASFERRGHAPARRYPGNFPDEAFYGAHGRYSATFTCNNWAARILNRAGIRTGAWPIYESGVMRWLPPPR